MSHEPIKLVCRVFLDGCDVLVPWAVSNRLEARGALGLPRGVAVAREGERRALSFEGGHEFHEDERYVTLDALELLSEALP